MFELLLHPDVLTLVKFFSWCLVVRRPLGGEFIGGKLPWWVGDCMPLAQGRKNLWYE